MLGMPPALKIATFNVNGIRSRLANLLEWLERESPDVACLQELKARHEDFPLRELRAAGYESIWHGQMSWNGVAILSKGVKPIEVRRGLPGDESDTHSRYIEAAVQGVVVGCLYLPNGNPQPGPKFDYKLAWFERLIRHASGLHDSGHPVVLAGDYNVVPTDELDIYNPRSWRRDALLQPESRACWTRLLEQGWIDSLRVLHPGEKVFTFWDYFREHWPRNAGLRIDHLLLNPKLAPRLRKAGVDRWVRGLEGASDHAPTWVELEMGRGGSARARSARGGAAKADKPGTLPPATSQGRKPAAARTGANARMAKKAPATTKPPTAVEKKARGGKKPAVDKARKPVAKKAPAGRASRAAPKPRRR
jgi:exodeoxyribonuclease-3